MLTWLKHNRGFLVFMACFGFFRLAIADWNPIPSGSMRPTLLEGDVVLVNRVAYDFKLPLSNTIVAQLGEPQRGDVVVFFSPQDGTRLIKRLVAVPGDVVQMKDEVLTLNGQPLVYRDPQVVEEPLRELHTTVQAIRATELADGKARAVQFMPAVNARRDFGPITVPAGQYFFLGDNRDNSADSRYIGSVPRHLLVGQAHHILASADIKGNWLPRLERIGDRIE